MNSKTIIQAQQKATTEPFPQWITVDVAIEIIGNMVADEVATLRRLKVDPITNLSLCQQSENRLQNFHSEIKQLYKGINIDEILIKVDQEYAPYIKRKYAQAD